MKKIKIIKPAGLYKWAKNFKRIQDRFYNNQYKLKRIQQIEDFIILNGFLKVFHDEEVLLDMNLPIVTNINESDLILVTHQGYSRYPLDGIIDQINKWLDICPNLYICLNRHYLNIDNKKPKFILTNDFQQAITEWLKKSLGDGISVVDLSSNYIDFGQHFTWSVPDRHYYVSKK